AMYSAPASERPSNPKACPLWTTKSLNHGLMSSVVQRSCAVHPPDPCPTVKRRKPLLSLTLIRRSPFEATAGWTIGTPSHACSQSNLPSVSDTLVTPVDLSSTIWCMPLTVNNYGEL